MRITVVNAARNYGGQEAMAALLTERFASRGHDVLFLCRPVYPALDRIPEGVEIAPVLGGVDWSPLAIWRSRRALRRHGSDVMLVTTNKDLRSAGVAARTLRIPVVIRRAMARPLKDSSHYRYLYGELPARLVANSRTTLGIMLDSAPWLDEDRTAVIHNGIDLGRFRNVTPVDLGLPPDAVAVGFVGRFVDWKGVLTLVDAWRRVAPSISRAHLVLVGEGEEEEEMRRRLDGSPRVRWLGFRTDVPQVMAALDVLVYPSVMEGFGLAAVEGMASGLPLIVAEAGSLPEVVGDAGAGRFVPPHDASALGAALVELVTDAELRRTMGARGRERVEELFDLERMVDRYEEVLREAASGEVDAR